MSKKGKNGVVTLDASDPAGTAERLLEAMTEEERAEVLKKYVKPRGNDKAAKIKQQFLEAEENFKTVMPSIADAMQHFPTPTSVTVRVDEAGNVTLHKITRLRGKYKPRDQSSE